MKSLLISLFSLGLFLPAPPAHAQPAREYAIILEDAPVARQIGSRFELRSARALDHGARIEQAQQELRRRLAERNVRVIASVKTVLNAVFVSASEQDVAALRSLPGVRRVAPSRELKLHLNTALPLVKAPQAWTALSNMGITNPGAGIKIALIDTGIDQNHPAFQDSLPPAEGAPACVNGVINDSRNNCAYTNSKVIVARSYVWMSAQGTADISSPDDYSPRDRVGHGTAAAMIAAGAENQGPLAKIGGVAPKAYLGNYKVFGSPGVNDGTRSSAVIKALDDAINDGMDIASLSLGFPAWYGPNDKGADCGDTNPEASCEVDAQAVENAVKSGMVVAVSAGNDGDAGLYIPSLSTIHTPGIASSALTVGATRNGHEWFAGVSASGAGAPNNVKNLPAVFGDGPVPSEPFTAPLRDVNGLGCGAIASGLVNGAIALIQRGNCFFSEKVQNAEAAGAVGVIFYCNDTQYCADGGERPFSPSGLGSTSIPAVLVGKTSGGSLKAYAGTHSDAKVTLDPALKEYVDSGSDTVASFSSRGPSIAPDSGLKPEVVAPGTNIYTAAQKYDTNGQLYGADGYTVADGTSFSAPMAAGVAALVKQRNSSFTPAQIKSAIVNTATLVDAPITDAGAGKLNAEGAVKTNVTVEPATVAFGVLTEASMGLQKQLQVTNNSNSTLTLNAGSDARLQLSSTTVAPRTMKSISVYLQGGLPAAGSYGGAITITGGAVDLRVPFQYLVGDGVPDNVIPVTSLSFDGTVNDLIPGWISMVRVLDRYGVAVANEPVTWTTSGGASVSGADPCKGADPATARYGAAAACITLGPTPDTSQQVTATIGSGSSPLQFTFDAFPRARPAIGADGVVNGASWQAKNGSLAALAPGSYISIFGTSLSDGEASFDWYLPPNYIYLPVSLAGVSVSFDSGNISVPGHLSYARPGQINVQVPWELQGQSSANIKVTLGDSRSAVYNIKIADAAPGIFEFDPYSTGQMWAAAQHPTNPKYTDIGPSKPAQKGEIIVVWANGLGPVNNQPASGELSPSSPLAKTASPVSVTIGGKAAQVDFSGLSPNFIGLYQVNLKVPTDARSGVQDMVITVNGNSSKPAKISIQ